MTEPRPGNAVSADRIGQEIAVSRWLEISQDRIDVFGGVTRDMDWMHIDPSRAARESPFGTTIAFGFQTMSMLTWFSHDAGLWPDGTHHGINYGFDRLRLISPVPAGSRVRGRFTLKALEERADGGKLATLGATVEIEGAERPALVGDWLVIFYPEGAG